MSQDSTPAAETRLTPEEAKAVLEAITAVERKEAADPPSDQ